MTANRAPYDPNRAYADTIEAEDRMERIADCWGELARLTSAPDAANHHRNVRRQLEALRKRRAQEYGDHCLQQIQYWGPSPHPRLLVRLAPPKGMIA